MSTAAYTTLSIEELEAMLQGESSLLLVDLRAAAAYRLSHLPGAVSFPMKPTWLEKLVKRGRLKSLLGKDLHKRVVFY